LTQNVKKKYLSQFIVRKKDDSRILFFAKT